MPLRGYRNLRNLQYTFHFEPPNPAPLSPPVHRAPELFFSAHRDERFVYTQHDIIHVWYWNWWSNWRVHYVTPNIMGVRQRSFEPSFNLADVCLRGVRFQKGLIRIERFHSFVNVFSCNSGCGHPSEWLDFSNNYRWTFENPAP